MAHAMAMEQRLNFKVTGIGMVHHEMRPLGQFFYGVFSPEQRRGAAFTFSSGQSKDYSSKNKHALSLQPVATAHMRVSLIIEAEDLSDVDGIERFLSTAKFSGGQIVSHGKPMICESIEEALGKKKGRADVGVKNGFVVMDRRDLMKPRDGKNQADLFVEGIGQTVEGQSWISGACVGYATITEMAPRDFAREGYLHAFAEPLIGLVQYRSIRSLDKKEYRNIIWRPSWETTTAFCIKQ
jgi:CRISPR-associated protein Csy2